MEYSRIACSNNGDSMNNMKHWCKVFSNSTIEVYQYFVCKSMDKMWCKQNE